MRKAFESPIINHRWPSLTAIFVLVFSMLSKCLSFHILNVLWPVVQCKGSENKFDTLFHLISFKIKFTNKILSVFMKYEVECVLSMLKNYNITQKQWN